MDDRISEILGLDRRQFLTLLGAAGAAGALPFGTASAQVKEVVLANWGGEAVKAMTEAFASPFEKSSGLKVAIDTTGPTAGKVRAMVESGKVTWDVCDATGALSLELGRAGLLEPIDYTVVDKGKAIPGVAYPWGVGSYVYSSVLTYDSSKFAKDKQPHGWADFFNLKDFPGKRLMRRDITAMLEPALLADGVDKDKLYPLDVDRAFAKIKTILPNSLFWKTAAEGVQMLRDGEVVMGNIWNTRSTVLKRETQGRINWTWEGGVLQPAVWAVPKGNPAGKAVMQFIASMQQPEGQVVLLKALGNGPANPAAAGMVPAELQDGNPTAPGNIDKQVLVNAEWYADNYRKTNDRWLDFVSG